MSEPSIPISALRRAAADGVITSAQLDRLLHDVPDDARADAPSEARGGLGAVHVAYGAGAVLVLFAFGWFLVDRWRALGPAGVLAVTLGYAALLLVIHVRLAREGFRVASGVALLLAVGMAPLATWAAQEWLLPLDPAVRAVCGWGWGLTAACTSRWVAMELVTVLAALVALRRVRFAPLALPPAIALFFLAHHFVRAAHDWPYASGRTGWSMLAASSLLLALAYGVDRRLVRRRTGGAFEDDLAAWFFVPPLVAGTIALGELWGTYRELHWVMPLVALALAAGALRLRRRLLLAAAAGALLTWLGWLAFDVFRYALAFPLLLATFGIAVILLAVLVQRLAPRLVRARPQVLGDSPAAWAIVLAPAVLALLMGPDALRRDREQAAHWRVLARQQALHHRTLERERARTGTSDPAPPRKPTSAETRPVRGS